MQKFIVGAAVVLAILGALFLFITREINTGTNLRKAKEDVVVSDTNAGISKEAKGQGEAATLRADKAKAAALQSSTKLKEEIHANSESIDDLPLPLSDIIILCKSYHRTDEVCAGSDKSD